MQLLTRHASVDKGTNRRRITGNLECVFTNYIRLHRSPLRRNETSRQDNERHRHIGRTPPSVASIMPCVHGATGRATTFHRRLLRVVVVQQTREHFRRTEPAVPRTCHRQQHDGDDRSTGMNAVVITCKRMLHKELTRFTSLYLYLFVCWQTFTATVSVM